MKRSAKAIKRASDKRKKDAEFRQLLLERDGHCVVDPERYGGHGGALHVSHFFTKGQHQWLRWDPDDACIMCLRHHLFWWHREVAEAGAWLRKYLGVAKYEALYRKAQQSPKLAETRRRT